MKYVFDNDLHIHSKLSLCSGNPEQTPERILRYAKENGVKTLCLTDHFWDETVPGASEWYSKQDSKWISAWGEMPKDDEVRFLFGVETDMDKFMTVGVAKENFDKYDFIVIPTTHLHMMHFTLDMADNSIESRAELWVKRLDALLDKDLPFNKIGIAHLACRLIKGGHDDSAYVKILDAIKSEDMERLFKKAAKLGCGIELNQSDMAMKEGEEESVLRMFRIAKACGCKFYCGSDAHNPGYFVKTKAVFERAIDLLELTEDDKFII